MLKFTKLKVMKRKIYLDYAATTPVDPGVLKAMFPYFTERFGNSVSLHGFGEEAKKALEKARLIMAKALNAKNKDEIIFTSSATESNNLAIKGIALPTKTKESTLLFPLLNIAAF